MLVSLGMGRGAPNANIARETRYWKERANSILSYKPNDTRSNTLYITRKTSASLFLWSFKTTSGRERKRAPLVIAFHEDIYTKLRHCTVNLSAPPKPFSRLLLCLLINRCSIWSKLVWSQTKELHHNKFDCRIGGALFDQEMDCTPIKIEELYLLLVR